MNRSFVVSAVFVLGCATGGAASHYVSAAQAQSPPPGTPRWAYECFKHDEPDHIEEESNKRGAQGWELVSGALSGGAATSSPIWCFKRQY